MTHKKLTPRGGPVTTALAHELDLHCYPWPTLLGESRDKWVALRKTIDKAALIQHKRECASLQPDGRTRLGPTPFTGRHKRSHQSRIEIALVDLLEAGIPSFLIEK